MLEELLIPVNQYKIIKSDYTFDKLTLAYIKGSIDTYQSI